MVETAELERTYREHVAWLSREVGALLDRAGWDGLVVHSGRPQPRTVFDDQFWPLRPTPHFQHWLPLARPDAAVLVVPGRRPTLFYDVSTNFWERPSPPETDHFWGEFDVVEVEGAERVRELLPPGARLGFVGEDSARAASWGFAAGAQNPPALLGALDELRVTKTPYEVLCLAEANRRAAVGHEAVRRAFLDGDHSELELHLVYLRATAQDDPETPYKNIVALGAHAATLHHVHYGRTAPGGPAGSLLLDAGAAYQGYSSDVTRTHVKGRGAGAQAFAALVAGMDRLQQEMCRRVQVGVPYERLHDEAHELLAPLLREVGVARGSDEELVARGVTRAFLPHGLGHSLGLQCHDVGCAEVKPRPENPFLRNTRIIAEGQVFTIEPGCYFIDELLAALETGPVRGLVDWSTVAELRRFGGVRIEDDIAVAAGDSGPTRNLTREVLPA